MITVEKPQRKSLEKHQIVKRQPAPFKKERLELAIQPIEYLASKGNSQSVRNLRSPENKTNPPSIRSIYVPITQQKVSSLSPSNPRSQKLLSSRQEPRDNINMTLPINLPSQNAHVKSRRNLKSIDKYHQFGKFIC